MLKFITKLTSILTITSLIITALAVAPAMAEGLTDAELEADDVYNPADSNIAEMTLDVRWGYVRGNTEEEKSEKSYNGSISATDYNTARIGLVKTLLFENNDTLLTEKNPVSWTSNIYGHWDGVMAHVLAKADATITVQAGEFTISKTVSEWFAFGKPAVDRIGDQMLVVKVNKKKHRRHGVIIMWGKKDQGAKCDDMPSPGANSESLCTTPPEVDFTGTILMDKDTGIRLKRKLRFEDNDKVYLELRNEIGWNSYITTGRDGLFTLMLPDRNVSTASGFTVEFSELPEKWTKHYTFAEVKNGIREIIEVNDEEYVLLIGRKHIVKQLVKARRSKRLYLIEDNIKHEVDNNDVLAANGLSEDEAVEMDDDELEAYEEGDELNYPNGSIVEDGENKYVIENGQKRLLASQEVIDRFIYAKRLFARLVSTLRLNRFVAGEPVTNGEEITDDSLIKLQGDSAVWRVRGNKRQVFTHSRIFGLHRLDFDQIKTITQEQFNELDWAPPVEYPDGSLVKIPTDPKVYLIKGGLRHWIETEADLNGLGYDFSDIVDMPPTEIINYDEGDPVISE